MQRLLFGRYPFSISLALVFALLAALCFSSSYWVWAKYRVTSLVRAPENIASYRELVPQAWKSSTVARYAQSIPGLSAAQRQRLISLTNNLESGISGSIIEPQFAFENKERKDLAGFLDKLGQDRTDLLLFLGTKIQTRHRLASQALQDNQLLANAFRDALLYEELARFSRNENNKLIKDHAELEARQIQLQQTIISLQKRAADLETLRSQYPDRNTAVQLVNTSVFLQGRAADLETLRSQYSDRNTTVQLGNTSETAYRYLPLRDQIVALKSEQADIRDQLKKIDWQLKFSKLKQTFLAAFNKDFVNAKNGATGFQQFEKQVEQLSLYSDIYQEMLPLLRAELNQKLQRWHSDYLSASGVTVESSAPAQKNFPWGILIATALFAALIGGFVKVLNQWFKQVFQEQ